LPIYFKLKKIIAQELKLKVLEQELLRLQMRLATDCASAFFDELITPEIENVEYDDEVSLSESLPSR
jgi:hypothetical protein